jgi:hypothetical protein
LLEPVLFCSTAWREAVLKNPGESFRERERSPLVTKSEAAFDVQFRPGEQLKNLAVLLSLSQCPRVPSTSARGARGLRQFLECGSPLSPLPLSTTARGKLTRAPQPRHAPSAKRRITADGALAGLVLTCFGRSFTTFYCTFFRPQRVGCSERSKHRLRRRSGLESSAGPDASL